MALHPSPFPSSLLSSFVIFAFTLFQFCLNPSFGFIVTTINDLEWSNDQRLMKNYLLYLESACNLEFGFAYVQEIPMNYEFLQNFELPKDVHGDGDGDAHQCIVLGLLQGLPSYV
jgi:hypothetical protein